MNSFIWNLIELNVVIIVLFTGFMAMRNRLSFRQQRWVLVGLPFLAIAAITIKSLVDFSEVSYTMPIVALPPVYVGQAQLVTEVQQTLLSWTLIYEIGVLCIGLLLVFRLVKLGAFFAKNDFEKREKYRIYRVNGKSSFSFFNNIQITPGLSDAEQEIVLEHEKMHVKKMHSLDILIMELMHVAFWFNPIFFFMKRELINLHEFEVDAMMYRKHKVGYMKFLLNYALGLKTSNYLLTSRFYNRLTLKKRIKTMKTNYKKRGWILGFIPLAAFCVILIQCTKEDLTTNSDENTPDRAPVEEPVVDGIAALEDGGEEGIVDYFTKVWGGDEQGEIPFFVSVYSNLHYPEEAIANQEEGSVRVEFIVSKTGRIEDAWVTEGVSESLDAEALRVVLEAPYFMPTYVDGEAVRAKYWVPVIFELERAEEQNSKTPEERIRRFYESD